MKATLVIIAAAMALGVPTRGAAQVSKAHPNRKDLVVVVRDKPGDSTFALVLSLSDEGRDELIVGRELSDAQHLLRGLSIWRQRGRDAYRASGNVHMRIDLPKSAPSLAFSDSMKTRGQVMLSALAAVRPQVRKGHPGLVREVVVR